MPSDNHPADRLAVRGDDVHGTARRPGIATGEELVAGDEPDVLLHAGDPLRGFSVLRGQRALNLLGRGEPPGSQFRGGERIGELLAAHAQVHGQPCLDRVALLALGDPARDPGREHDHDRRKQQRPKS